MPGQGAARQYGWTLRVGKISVRFLRPITALAGCAMFALVPASTALAQRQQADARAANRSARAAGQRSAAPDLPEGPPRGDRGILRRSGGDPVVGDRPRPAHRRARAAARRDAPPKRGKQQSPAHRRNRHEPAASEQEQRIQALEQRINEAAVAAPVTSEAAPPLRPPPRREARPKPSSQPPKAAEASPPAAAASATTSVTAEASDPGEDAYSEGFHQWEAGNYDESIATLRSFVSAYPKHRRVSYANNLIGRALLDKGQARDAATALLANYRNNPGGERAPDSLFYLGQALMKLGQPAQACKAYSRARRRLRRQGPPRPQEARDRRQVRGQLRLGRSHRRHHLRDRACHHLAISRPR